MRPADVPRPGQLLHQGKETIIRGKTMLTVLRHMLTEQMAMGLCNAIQATWAQTEKDFQLVEKAQKLVILIPISCPAPFAPEKHCSSSALCPPW